MAGNGRSLKRSRDDHVLAGVCGGIAKWLDLSSTGVRIFYVLLSICSSAFPGIIVYIILALLLPVDDA